MIKRRRGRAKAVSLFLLSCLETHECRPHEGYEEDGGQYDVHYRE